MTSPSLELQGAIVTRLKATGAVTALIGQRIYDSIGTGATFPYVRIGPVQAISDDTNCVVGFEVFQQIDIFSRAVGSPEAKRIADAVRRALVDTDLTLADNALVYFEHRDEDVRMEPDGLTTRAILTFTAFIEQP